MNCSVTRPRSGVVLALCVSVSLSTYGIAAADAPKVTPPVHSSVVSSAEGGTRLQNGAIAYVLTHKFWAVYETPKKEECPTGMNDGPREQFRTLYGDGKGEKKYTIVEAQLKREG